MCRSWASGNTLTQGTIENPSFGNGYDINTNPSLAFYFNNTSPALGWKVVDNVTYQSKAQLRIKYNGSNWSQFWTWSYGGGDDINSANMNSNIDNKFVLAWGGNQNNRYITSQSPSNVYNLSTYGDVQVSNSGSTMGDMKISSFNYNSAPYYFIESAVTQGLYKPANDSNLIVSKGVCITCPNGMYRFDLGGIKVNDSDVLFTDDNFDNTVATIKNGNKLETNTFNLTDNSNFNFLTHFYPSPNSANVKDKDAGVNFMVTLLDANTESLLGTLSTEDLSNVSYKENALSVNTKGIGSKLCKLRLKFNYGKNDTAVVYSSYETNSKSVNKKDYVMITYNNGNEIKNYALDQNYPNPFNPTTTIHYEIPNNGIVTLKVYDILGNVVMTLVDGYKPQGKYSVNFNAGGLASGVYFYRLKAGDFIATRKLLLIK